MSDPQQLSAEADRAAASGKFAEARALLMAATEEGGGTPDLWLRLAAVCRAQGELAAALAAATKALEADPLHFLALMLRAKLLEATNDPGADEAYGHALAQHPGGELPSQVTAMVAHAEQRYSSFQRATDRRLAQALSDAGVATDAAEARRLARFRTNVARLTRVFHSDPTDYHYPGLSEREFHDRERFDWLADLEAATDIIAREFAQVVTAERVEMVPYIQYPEHVPLRQWKDLNHSLDWSAIHLLRNGVPIAANVKHCPKTMKLLATLPQPYIDNVSPNAMFSLLAPGAHIPPHTGIANMRLVCHLPLIVPDGCWFRVGAERRSWRRGEAWVFDDTIEHEAMNESSTPRVILIVDVWHPDVGEGERTGISAMVEAHERRTERDTTRRGM